MKVLPPNFLKCQIMWPLQIPLFIRFSLGKILNCILYPKRTNSDLTQDWYFLWRPSSFQTKKSRMCWILLLLIWTSRSSYLSYKSFPLFFTKNFRSKKGSHYLALKWWQAVHYLALQKIWWQSLPYLALWGIIFWWLNIHYLAQFTLFCTSEIFVYIFQPPLT